MTTGQTGFQHAFVTGIWEYLADQPEASALFDAAMTGRSGPDDAAVASGYDFSGLKVAVDVAGGRGSLLAAILRANPDMRGTLFDQPHVIPGAWEYLTGAGLTQRCEFAAGDFIESVVAGGDAYILKRAIHDWDDERATRILERCRRAMPATGRLLVVETVIPPGNEPSFGKLLDVHMLVWTRGKERTEAEYRALLSAAGFELSKVVPTRSSLSVVEGVPR